MRRAILSCFLVSLASVSLTGAQQPVAIRAGMLVDPESGTVSANQIILVRDATIAAVGPSIGVPADARVIDLSNATVMPGLFDCHAHLAAWLIKPQRAIYTTWIHSTSFRVLRAIVFAREMLDAGFTTVRNLSEAGFYGDTALREAIEEGVIAGPTVVNAGRFVIPYGAEAPPNTEHPDLNAPDKVEADTRDELIKAVRENIHYGAKVIKILVDDTPYVYSTEDLRLVVAEAKQAGLKVAAHAVTDRGARNAAEAGVASIEHGPRLSVETLAIIKRDGVYIVPTPFTPHLIREMGIRLSGMKHDENYRDAEHVYGTYVSALKRNYESGALLAFGSDVGVLSDGWTRGTLAISTIDGWLAAGVPPAAIVRALTVNAARLLGVDTRRGFIKPGFAADIIATPRNPLQDVQTLKQVIFVMKDGAVHRRDQSLASGTGSR